MTIDETLRHGAADVRRAATRLAGSMSPPPSSAPSTSPRTSIGASFGAIAAALCLVAGLVLLVTVRESRAPTTDTTQTSPFVPIADRPGYFRHGSAGIDFWMPSSGWRATTETLTPNIGELDGVDAYRDADTVVSLSTKPFTGIASGETTSCPAMPFAALADLAPTDALVTVVESAASGLPDRRRATGIYEGEPERLYPAIGEANEGWCLDQVRATGDADLFYRQYTFADAGRSFTVHVALGSATTTSTQHDAWRILDRLTFHPPPAVSQN